MREIRTRYSLLRPAPAVATALVAAIVAALPMSAVARTVEFTSAPRGEQAIDLGLGDGELGIEGSVKFSLDKDDRQAAKVAKDQEQLLTRADQHLAASTRANNRIMAIERLLADVEGDQDRLEAEIRERLAQRYKDGDSGELEFLLSGDGLSDLIGRSQMLKDQSKRDERLIADYALTVERIEAYRDVLEELRDITGEQSQRLRQRADRMESVLVAARVGHDEAPDPVAAGTAKGIDGTWYIMDGAFQAQLFLPNAGSGYTGGTRTAARQATPQQIQRVLTDSRIDLDASGMQDVATGQIDGRLLDALSLAAQQFNYVRVTSLKSDHGVYTSSGNVSAHSYGCAADIGTIGSTWITPGSQTPGSEVELAVRFFAGLQGDLAPHQVISLYDLGGATLAMGDHGDHIHLGYSC